MPIICLKDNCFKNSSLVLRRQNRSYRLSMAVNMGGELTRRGVFELSTVEALEALPFLDHDNVTLDTVLCRWDHGEDGTLQIIATFSGYRLVLQQPGGQEKDHCSIMLPRKAGIKLAGFISGAETSPASPVLSEPAFAL